MRPNCAVCQKPAIGCCEQCKIIAYCSVKCQEKNASEHLEVCSKEIGAFWNKDRLTITQIVVKSPIFDYLEAAVVKAGLDEILALKGPYTVFAPVDEAFRNLPPELLEALLQDRDELKNLLYYHVYPGIVTDEDLVMRGPGVLEMANKRMLSYRRTNRGIELGNQRVYIVGDTVKAKNGRIQAIGGVLIPPNFDLVY